MHGPEQTLQPVVIPKPGRMPLRTTAHVAGSNEPMSRAEPADFIQHVILCSVKGDMRVTPG